MTAPQQPQDGSAPVQPDGAPPWGSSEQFDPEKAWNLIQGLRADKERLQTRSGLTDEQQAQLAEYDQWKRSNQTEQQRQADELARSQAEIGRWRDAALNTRIESLAADFAYPADAVEALGDKAKYLTSGGQIREDQIKADLAELLERRPRWRKEQPESDPRLPWPNPAQGGTGQPALTPNDQMNALIRTARSGQ